MTHAVIDALGLLLEIAGVVLLAGGLAFALLRSGVAAVNAAARNASSVEARYARVRRDLGRAILLGLEVLVAADIVRSVALKPTMGGVGVLALIVVIRTFLSWSLALELDGHWPWQRPAAA